MTGPHQAGSAPDGDRNRHEPQMPQEPLEPSDDGLADDLNEGVDGDAGANSAVGPHDDVSEVGSAGAASSTDAGSPGDVGDELDARDREMTAALRRAISARVAAMPDASDWTPDDIADLAAARARRRTAGRAGLAVAAGIAVVAAVVGWRLLHDDAGNVVVAADALYRGEAGEVSGSADERSDGSAADSPGGVPEDPEAEQPTAPSQMTSEARSSGPVLSWTEVDSGLWEAWGLQTLSDGRVLAHGVVNSAEWPEVDTREVAVVTSDGVTWTDVSLPPGVSSSLVAASGELWVAAGRDMFGGFDGADSDRVYVSTDNADTWTELSIESLPGTAPASPWVTPTAQVTSALVSGDDIVVAVRAGASLEVAALAEARGVVPADRTAAGWIYYGSPDRTVTLLLEDRAGTGSDTSDTSGASDGDGAFVVGGQDQLDVTFEELGLTDEEQEALLGGSRPVWLLHSDGDTLEVTTTTEGNVRGTVTDDGFVLYVVDVFGSSPGSILTSADGRSWDERPFDTFGISEAAFAAGAVWIPVYEPSGTRLDRAAFGETPQPAALFEGLTALQLHAGPAGLAVTASADADSGFAAGSVIGPDGSDAAGLGAGELTDAEFMESLLPSVAITVDGYELRYNEPPGGMTLWDVSAEAAVRVFDAGTLLQAEIDGVRETPDGDGISLTFEDPDSGADLVTFGADELSVVADQFAAAMDELSAELSADSAAALDASSDDFAGFEGPEYWLGWSSDGSAWGWQELTETFGPDIDTTWVEVAVGRDFVVAVVHPTAVQPVPAPDGSDALVAVPQRSRLLVAPAG